MIDKHINQLTIIANQSYESFAKELQSEIELETGVQFGQRIKNIKQKQTINLKEKALSQALFLELWERIKYKSTYHVTYEFDTLIERATDTVKHMPVTLSPNIVKTLAGLSIDSEGIDTSVTSIKQQTVNTVQYRLPDFLSAIQDKTELTRTSIAKVLKQSGRLNDVLINPQMFIDSAIKAINQAVIDVEVNHVVYSKLNEQFYDVRMFDVGDIERYLDNLVPVNNQDKTMYDFIETDSDTEKAFAKACDTVDEILFYVKLPRKFAIKTPVGDYLPDWALIRRDHDDAPKIYFVAETKGINFETDELGTRLKEKHKVACGKKHFELFKELVTYRIVNNLSELC